MMARKKILFICGTLNQTTIMHQVSEQMKEFDLYFTPYYSDGFLNAASKIGLAHYTVLGRPLRQKAVTYLKSHDCCIDERGEKYKYDLVITCSDLLIQMNIRNNNIVLVQEGMTDPENCKYHLVKSLKLPRFLGNTSMTGLSHAYSTFCVASEGFKQIFINKGCNPEKLAVTGLPNFDSAHTYIDNDFPYKDYLLVTTSHLRETYKFENRKRLIKRALKLADGRQVLFKLHPSENRKRAVKEIKKIIPDALIFTHGNTNHMIANCSAMLTRYSTVILVALALGKKIYSDLDSETLRLLKPLQNNGTSASRIAEICRKKINA